MTLHYITLRYVTLHYITLRTLQYTLHYVTLRCVTLHYITLRYITLHTYIYILYIHIMTYTFFVHPDLRLRIPARQLLQSCQRHPPQLGRQNLDQQGLRKLLRNGDNHRKPTENQQGWGVHQRKCYDMLGTWMILQTKYDVSMILKGKWQDLIKPIGDSLVWLRGTFAGGWQVFACKCRGSKSDVFPSTNSRKHRSSSKKTWGKIR